MHDVTKGRLPCTPQICDSLKGFLHSECLLGAEVDIFFVEFLNT